MMVTCRITDGWLPLPDGVLDASGWEEGDTVEIEVVDRVIVVSWVDPQPVRAARVAPAKRRSLVKAQP